MATNWAKRTKETLAAVPSSAVPAGFEAVAGGGSTTREPIKAYYRYSAPKTEGGLGRQVKKGDKFTGNYMGSFTDQFGKAQHKIRTEDGLVAIAGSARLTRALANIPEGTYIQVVYNGKITIEGGDFAGMTPHDFSVAADFKNTQGRNVSGTGRA
jgi:hypothetical protein